MILGPSLRRAAGAAGRGAVRPGPASLADASFLASGSSCCSAFTLSPLAAFELSRTLHKTPGRRKTPDAQCSAQAAELCSAEDWSSAGIHSPGEQAWGDGAPGDSIWAATVQGREGPVASPMRGHGNDSAALLPFSARTVGDALSTSRAAPLAPHIFSVGDTAQGGGGDYSRRSDLHRQPLLADRSSSSSSFQEAHPSWATRPGGALALLARTPAASPRWEGLVRDHLRAMSSAPSADSPKTAGAKPGATSATATSATAPGQAGGSPGGAGSARVSTAAVGEDLAEECDEAVEDLGEVKARVRAAREAMRKGKGVLRASWLVVSAVARNSWSAVASLRVVFSWGRKEWAETFAGWGKAVRHAAHHYWVGTKLLWADMRISSRLFLKTAKGQSLTRREKQQLMRTSADIFRLVPFAVFILVPFMEFLLPVALRLFPNMLPSTYQDQKQEEAKLKRLLQARLQMARFLQDTVQEMAKEVKGRRSGDVKKTADELARFMQKVRTGGKVSNEEIIGFASLFNDELTLDNMTRPRLVSMCKYMGLQTFGTDAYLRYILRSRLAWIKEDDKMIQAEGVESLSEEELRAACRERGMLGLKDVNSMHHQLHDWLDLSLNRSVPSSLLILSRSFLIAGKVRPEEAVQATLSSLPERVVASVEASVPAGDATSERLRKLDKLREEERLIREEAEAEEKRLKEEAEALRMAARDRALEEMREEDLAAAGAVPLPAQVPPEDLEMAQELVRARKDQLCDLSAALAVLASSSSVSKERMDFLRLVNREIEMYNSLVEQTGSESEEEARALYAAAREASEKEALAAPEAEGGDVSEALINKVDSMLQKLEKELDKADAKFGTKLRILDTDFDGKVTEEEVAAAASMLRDSLGQGQVPELIANLAKDQDGKILVEDIVRLGTMDAKEGGDEAPLEGKKSAQAL